MDPDFKKILEKTYIDNETLLPLSEIKKKLKLRINFKKLKQILFLIYSDDLKEIHMKNRIYFNVNVTRNQIKELNYISFWNLYNDQEIKRNHDLITGYYSRLDPNYYNKNISLINKTFKELYNNVIYFCLASGVPSYAIPQVLNNASFKANTKEINTIYNDKKNNFKRINKVCFNCGSIEHLELHHIEPMNKAPSLKYNLNNWCVLCSECHKKVHQGVIKL